MRRRNGKEFRYKDRVDIQRDASCDGEVEPQWRVFLKEVNCFVKDTGGMSSYRGVQLEETVSTVVELYYIDGLTPDMRIIYEGRVLEIKYLNRWRSGTARTKHLAFCNEVVV